MAKFLLRRLATLVLTLLAISLVISLVLELLPGDAAEQLLGAWAERTGQTVQALRVRLGLDLPWYARYFGWLAGALVGDLGRSLAMDASVTPLVLDRLSASLRLAIPAFVLAVAVSLLFGTLAAVKRNKAIDHAITAASLAGVSVPAFIMGAILILVFSGWLDLVPPSIGLVESGSMMFWLSILVLPVMTLAMESLAHMTRMTRSSVVEVLKSPYIRAARIRGLPSFSILIRHALRNALIPTITIAAFNFGWLLGGVVIVEKVFNYPGLGSLVLFAIEQRDLPLLQGAMFFIAAGYCIANLAADVLYTFVNPKVRFS
jgi:peptide/nickel transport system permease protein